MHWYGPLCGKTSSCGARRGRSPAYTFVQLRQGGRARRAATLGVFSLPTGPAHVGAGPAHLISKIRNELVRPLDVREDCSVVA